MRIAGYDIGVCSWSLRPADAADLVAKLRQLSLSHVQLALGPLVTMDARKRKAELETLRAAGITVTAGMIAFAGENYSSIATIRETGGFVPSKEWPARQELTVAAAELAQEMGLTKLSTHVGFIPPSNHPHYQTLIARVRDVAQALGDMNIRLLLETGQEQAYELLQFLNDLSVAEVGVNFDPANMILYGAGDPMEAIRILSRHIGHVHVKDAILSDQPGVRWGQEVSLGTGEVPVAEFLEVLGAVGYDGPLVIEREAGRDRMADVRAAIECLKHAEAGEEGA